MVPCTPQRNTSRMVVSCWGGDLPVRLVWGRFAWFRPGFRVASLSVVQSPCSSNPFLFVDLPSRCYMRIWLTAHSLEHYWLWYNEEAHYAFKTSSLLVIWPNCMRLVVVSYWGKLWVEPLTLPYSPWLSHQVIWLTATLVESHVFLLQVTNFILFTSTSRKSQTIRRRRIDKVNQVKRLGLNWRGLA